MVSEYMKEPSTEEATNRNRSLHISTSYRSAKSSYSNNKKHGMRDSGNCNNIQPPPYTITQITTQATSNDFSGKGGLGRKLSDLLLEDKEYMMLPSPSLPSSSVMINDFYSSPASSSGMQNGKPTLIPNDDSNSNNNDGLLNPIVREATPAESNAFSRILLPKNVVPRLLRILQDNLQPKQKKSHEASPTNHLMPRVVLFTSHVSTADKVYRLLEYTLRLLAYLSYLRSSKAQGRRFLNIALALADTRAGMRLLGLLIVADRFYSLFGYKLFGNSKNTGTGQCKNSTSITHQFIPSQFNNHFNARTSHHGQQQLNDGIGISSDNSISEHSSLMPTGTSTTLQPVAHSMLVDPILASTNNTSHSFYTPSVLTKEEKMSKALGAWQIILLAFYYPLDHVKWLCRHKAINLENSTAKRISRYASAFWGTYLILDLAANSINLLKSNRQVSMVLRQSTLLNVAREHSSANCRNTVVLSHNYNSRRDNYEVDVSEEHAMLKRELETYSIQRADWFWRLVGNLVDLPIALDATLANGILPHGIASLSGIIGSAVAIWTRWRSIHGISDTMV